MKHVLVATDGSEGANRAVDSAAALAKQAGGDLVIVHVSEAALSRDMQEFMRAERATEHDVLEAAAAEILARARARAERAGASRVRVKSCLGDVTESILKAAAQEHADAIVVGKRGRGPLAALLIGSVSQKLVSLAPCSVIVVP